MAMRPYEIAGGTDALVGPSRAERGIAGQNPPIPPFTKRGIEGGFADACPTIHSAQ